MTIQEHELIIVGGGPAGLCAALYAGRSEMDAVLLEKAVPGGQLLLTEMVDDYPGVQEIGGMELAREMTEHAERFGVGPTRATVTDVRRDDRGRFVVETEEETTYRAPAVVFTAGGEPRRLGVPGEEEFLGKGVSYCAICDGAFFKGETIAVVGGGDSAVEEGEFLTRYAERVHVIHRRDNFSAQAVLQRRLLENPKTDVIWNTIVEEIRGDEEGVTSLALRRVRTAEDGSVVELDETDELDVTGVFIFVGFRPNVHILGEHVEHDDGGYLLTDRDMRTSVPGLFVAGDARSQLVRQITTAVGDATTAVFAAEKYLMDLHDEEGDAAAEEAPGPEPDLGELTRTKSHA
ncbi:MAG: NAD(P)/FAD-dependent oxidoreductase [Gemmatimonadota bacterium]